MSSDRASNHDTDHDSDGTTSPPPQEPLGGSLQSNETRNLLDIVDNLRSQGISRYIALPEIIVCGEQSSGKSSVLEAISGVAFPSKDNLCTRFATELILRRGATTDIKISVMPGIGRGNFGSEGKRLQKFDGITKLEDLNLGAVIEEAKEIMGINDFSKSFSSDRLRLEISGPNQPHLTLVDLPGLFQAGSRTQSDADSDIVKSMVLSYMRSPRSIILAVVSAKSDFNNQSITRFAREIDKDGMRTLGLITKPDTLDRGSDMEGFYISLAQNKEVEFRLGWHVLRNRDYNTRNATLQERNENEEKFFSTGVWRSLPSTDVGAHSLKPRLSQILKDQISLQLGDVLTQIHEGLQECDKRLKMLGSSRGTLQEQRRYLLQVSQAFGKLIKAGSDGLYFDSFFAMSATNNGYNRRLRAVLQNTLTAFANTMHRKGHKYAIIDVDSDDEEGGYEVPRYEKSISDGGSNDEDENDPNTIADELVEDPEKILRSDYLGRVQKLLKRSRGRELPGTFDPLIIGELFHEQRQPWSLLVNVCVAKITNAVYYLVREALIHTTDASTLDGLLKHLIGPRFKALTSELQLKVEEILAPHEIGHPITYNHYLTENVQKAQEERRTREIKRSLRGFFGDDYTGRGTVNMNINIDSLMRLIVSETEADMDRYASSTATDYMQAYYKVALKRVVDDVSVLAIEARLIGQLPTLFSPEVVLDMKDGMVEMLAAEDERSLTERRLCNEKKRILEEGLKELQGTQHGYRSAHGNMYTESPAFQNVYKMMPHDENAPHELESDSQQTTEGQYAGEYASNLSEAEDSEGEL